MSGQGVAQAEPTEQITAFLNSSEPIWDNEGDRAILMDGNGRTVDEERHGAIEPVNRTGIDKNL